MRVLTISILLTSALYGMSGSLQAVATEAATQDGRPFASLSAEAISSLSPADQQAYQDWQQASQPPMTRSTYQEETGPNTMDLSADFSM
jgi:hypothetical protein